MSLGIIEKETQPTTAFDIATQVTYLGTTDHGTFLYAGEASKIFAVGNISNGGYTVSIALEAVLQRYAGRSQVDPIALNAFFLRKTLLTPVVIEVEDLKLSRMGYCLCKASLKQRADAKVGDARLTRLEDYDPKDYLDKVVSVVTMGNIANEKGVTHFHKLPSSHALDKTRVYQSDPNNFLPGVTRISLDTACHRASSSTARDPELHQVVEFVDQRPMDAKSLPFWCDMFSTPPSQLGTSTWGGRLWGATMQMEVQFKRRLTPDDKQLAVSVTTHTIANSRFDIDGFVWDKQGQLICTTRHQCLALPWERNVKKETKL
ncbi:hypothetical protein DM01DRAFT_1333000 [Hesseltinella vesiculosa]|uniref:Thioesterase/thiol ester dehydrase-isomerase n=1 Tax=Hesseltinella vesiculosa TaxID=101127 RepID=A0A1X2GR56_9FUNG|nr:hypothetical protein DM01DRAFT_1333000 [Hesseltinella vesiculosa]